MAAPPKTIAQPEVEADRNSDSPIDSRIDSHIDIYTPHSQIGNLTLILGSTTERLTLGGQN